MSIVGQMILRSIEHAAPEAKASVKWAQPVFEHQGPFAFFKAYGNHINLGFWRGAELQDEHGILQGEGERMRHMSIQRPEDFKPQYVEALVRQAIALNEEHGDPTRKKEAPPEIG